LGQKLISCENVVREFKFSILDDASKYYHSVNGEHVLLQGVVDCAMIEKDGITVIDFKTDRVTEDSLHLTSEKYRTQVEAYASALERIYRLPVKSAVLYFFEVTKFIDII
jgi:ATP-dependent helicase/nuclease subunit A